MKKNNFLEINNVNFKIGGNTKVKNATFYIENEGETLCILGPSGIGKTTILRTIAGLEKVDKGSINLNGKMLSSKDIHVEPEHRNISLEDNNLPFNLIEPLSTFSKPAIVLNIVVFPIPEGPRIHNVSPSFSIQNETFLTLVFPPI